LDGRAPPIALTKAATDPDTAAAQRAFDAMMQMKKTDLGSSSPGAAELPHDVNVRGMSLHVTGNPRRLTRLVPLQVTVHGDSPIFASFAAKIGTVPLGSERERHIFRPSKDRKNEPVLRKIFIRP